MVIFIAFSLASIILPVPLLFTVIQNLLTAAAGCQAATGVLIISQSGVFYLPPTPLIVSMGANGDIFLIKMRQGEYEMSSLSYPNFVPIGNHIHKRHPVLVASQITAAPSPYFRISMKFLNFNNESGKLVFHLRKSCSSESCLAFLTCISRLS